MAVKVQSETLLEVNQLNVDYLAANGTVHAVIDVSFSLRRGEILGLAGESGSGKSTLAYAITRLLRPPAMITGGEIRYYPREKGETLLSVDAISKDSPGEDLITMGAIQEDARGGDAEGEDANNPVPIEGNGRSIDLLQLSPAKLRKIRW